MKTAIRAEALRRRKKVTGDELENLSDSVQKKVIEICKARKARSVFVYMAVKDEVQTRKIIDELLRLGVEVSVPVCAGETMAAQKIFSKTTYLCNKYQIQEPEYNADLVVKPAQIDTVIVPGVAFDSAFHRIGHGKGCYDIYLEKLNAVKIALAFDCQLFESVPYEGHDVLMDMIVTPTKCLCRDKEKTPC